MRTITGLKRLSTLAITIFLIGYAPTAASATSSPETYGAKPGGTVGYFAKINSVTGEQITSLPVVAQFPSHPADGLKNVRGIAFNPTNNELYALDRYCEIITINTTTGASTTVLTTSSTGYNNFNDCGGLAITAAGDVLVGFRTTVKKLDLTLTPNPGYVALAGNPVFYDELWIAYEPVANKIIVEDNNWPNPLEVKSMNPDGTNITLLGTENYGGNGLTSTAFTTDGVALGARAGYGYFTGTTASFPAGMTASTAAQSSLSNDYWIAASFASAPSPSPTPTSTTTPQNTSLAETGVGSLVVPALVALGLLIFGIALLLGRRKNS